MIPISPSIFFFRHALVAHLHDFITLFDVKIYANFSVFQPGGVGKTLFYRAMATEAKNVTFFNVRVHART